jgi:hypothetical protein
VAAGEPPLDDVPLDGLHPDELANLRDVHQNCGGETPDFGPGRKRRSPLPRVALIRNGVIGEARLL